MDNEKTKLNTIYISIGIVAFFSLVGLVMARIPEHLFYEEGSILAICGIALPVFYGMYRRYKLRGILAMLALGIFSIAIETIGIYTGFPYSSFEYVSDFGYRLFGTTPWPVFLAWSPIVIGVYTLAQKWFTEEHQKYFAFLVLLILADLVLDPGAVARGLWSYTNGGFWYGVPIANFLGWIFSGSIAYGITWSLLRKSNTKESHTIYLVLPLVVLVAMWSTVALVYGMTPVAIIGLLVVIITFLGIHHVKKTSR